jgi:hypothetical protein
MVSIPTRRTDIHYSLLETEINIQGNFQLRGIKILCMEILCYCEQIGTNCKDITLHTSGFSSNDGTW